MSAGPTTARHPYGSKGNVVAYELYASKWAAFQEAERPGAYDSALESLATNHGCLEFQHACGRARGVCGAQRNALARQARRLPRRIRQRAPGGEDRCIDARVAGPSSAASCGSRSARALAPRTPEAMPLWHAQNWGGLSSTSPPRGALSVREPTARPLGGMRLRARKRLRPAHNALGDGQTKAVERRGRGDGRGDAQRRGNMADAQPGAARSGSRIGHARPLHGIDQSVPAVAAAQRGVARSARLLVAFDSQRGEKLLSNLTSSLSPAIYRTPGMHVLVEVVSGLVLDAMAGPDRADQPPLQFRRRLRSHHRQPRVAHGADRRQRARDGAVVLWHQCGHVRVSATAPTRRDAVAQHVHELRRRRSAHAQEERRKQSRRTGQRAGRGRRGRARVHSPTTPSRQSSCEDGGGELCDGRCGCCWAGPRTRSWWRTRSAWSSGCARGKAALLRAAGGTVAAGRQRRWV